MITAGQTNVKFTIAIMNDSTLENDESINLAINSNMLPNKITLGNPNKTVITIVDNDG